LNEIAYDDEYTGPALDPAEGARLARVIGDKSVFVHGNHASARSAPPSPTP